MRRSDDFSRAVRRGRRAGSPHLVVHLLLPESPPGPGRTHPSPAGSTFVMSLEPMSPPSAARAGLIVSKAVGNAVARTRVKRRLRALVAARLADLPAGSLLVVRANPVAAQAISAELATSLDHALARVLPVRSPA